MGKIKIITDSTSDISLEVAAQHDILVLSQSIIFGEDVYKETELAPKDFYEKLEAFGDIPKTAQIRVQDVLDAYKQYVDCQIIFITISAKGSGTNQTAHIARETILEEYPNADITIIDGKSFTLGYGQWVLLAARMAKEGKSKEEIIAAVEDGIARTEILIAVDTLEYLQKGGRLSPAAKVLANVLDLKPILTIEDGLVMSRDKVRGSKKLFPKIADMVVSNADDLEHQTVILVHGNTPEKAEQFRDELTKRAKVGGFDIRIVGPSVGTHIGPGVLGVIYLKKLQ